MLSILIPIYNYNAVPLVVELHRQCVSNKIDFEIICIDDCSTFNNLKNDTIKSLDKCFFFLLDQNIGRSKIRNQLAAKANYDWLLFLDCDTYPNSSQFISKYFEQIKQSKFNAVYGGLSYTNTRPPDHQILRWTYGRARESRPVDLRNKNPYTSTLVSNFMIVKSVFTSVQFDENICNYGYEDALFIQLLRDKNSAILQIENPVAHLNLETSALFLSKTKEALQTLSHLYQTNIIIESKIIKTYRILSKIKLVDLVAKVFTSLASILEKNLLSKKPSILVFDFYKISYFCFLNKK